MFGRYALPSDDYAGLSSSVSASAEDPEYPAGNLVALANTGHLNLPSRPAKLVSSSGSWTVSFDAPVTVEAAALIYHDLDAGLDVTINGEPIIIPPHIEGGIANVTPETVNAWVEFDTPLTASSFTLSINEANSLDVVVGRLLLIGTLRQLETDVRWGEEEMEDFGLIEHPTELGVETMYDLPGRRRAFAGELKVRDSEAPSLISLARSARGRILPWLLIPDEDINDAWLVRFEESRWSRTRETINFNSFPFRVRELSRGLPWP
jgi:hypothetical protein